LKQPVRDYLQSFTSRQLGRRQTFET
jgi:hypothetical protein